MADTRNTARTTIRLLESMVRLSQAHARLMCHTSVLLMDAITAVTVMESSMQGASLLGLTSPLHSAFPPQPDIEVSSLSLSLYFSLSLSPPFMF